MARCSGSVPRAEASRRSWWRIRWRTSSAGRGSTITRAELRAAAGRAVPDLIAPRLDLLFCGINPGLYSAATGHHFARPGNRFWPALHGGGFTDRLLAPWEERMLLKVGCGITNLAARATATAAELTPMELVAGRRVLEGKIARYAPRWVAFLGVGAYRTAFRHPEARIGRQDAGIGGTGIWVLPSPSGLNANHQLPELARLFRELRAVVRAEVSSPAGASRGARRTPGAAR